MSDIIRRLTRDVERESAATQRQMNRIMRAVRDQSFAPAGGYRPANITPVNNINVYLPPRLFR